MHVEQHLANTSQEWHGLSVFFTPVTSISLASTLSSQNITLMLLQGCRRTILEAWLTPLSGVISDWLKIDKRQ
jgi:hypothetical protein